MNPFDIRTMLSLSWETSAFPAEECVVESAHEAGIMDSLRTYLVLITDPRGDCGRIEVARPYTCKSPNGTLLYGWASASSSDEWFDHWERSVHNDNARVVAWAAVPKDFQMVPRGTIFPDTPED